MESMFSLPGLGRLMVTALEDRDYPVVSGINLFFATAVVLTNLLIDLLYTWLDPRVRHEYDPPRPPLSLGSKRSLTASPNILMP